MQVPAIHNTPTLAPLWIEVFPYTVVRQEIAAFDHRISGNEGKVQSIEREVEYLKNSNAHMQKRLDKLEGDLDMFTFQLVRYQYWVVVHKIFAKILCKRIFFQELSVAKVQKTNSTNKILYSIQSTIVC